jgi:hypothetical protein
MKATEQKHDLFQMAAFWALLTISEAFQNNGWSNVMTGGIWHFMAM